MKITNAATIEGILVLQRANQQVDAYPSDYHLSRVEGDKSWMFGGRRNQQWETNR